LPGSTEDLMSYNWANQSLIELKVYLKDYILGSNSAGGGVASPPVTVD